MSCKGCGAPLAPNRGPGPPKKWCSQRCRREQYSRPCPKCGTPMNGSSGQGAKAPLLCRSCNGKARAQRQRERFQGYREKVEGLWALGYTGKEIAEEMGWTTTSASSKIGTLRWRGYNLPHRRPRMIAVGEQLSRFGKESDVPTQHQEPRT